MFSGPLLASRKARQAEECYYEAALASAQASLGAQAAEPGTSASPSDVQGGGPDPGTPPRQAASPPRRPVAGRPDTAVSMGPETSLTDAPLLEELLPLLNQQQPVQYKGMAECSLGLASSMLGVALVALPRAFFLLGALPACFACLAVAALGQLACRCLADGARATGQDTYGGVLAAQLGPWAAGALQVAVAGNSLGMLVVHIVAAGDLLACDAGDAPAWLHLLLSRRPALLAGLSLVILAPLLSVRRLHSATAGSVLGVIAVAVWAGATFYLAAVLELKGEAQVLHPWPAPELLAGRSWLQAAAEVAGVLAVILQAFLCQAAFLPAVRQLELPASPRRMARAAGRGRRQRRHRRCFCLAVALSVVLALALGSQPVFGADIRDNVLSNFSVQQIRQLLHVQHGQLAASLALGTRGAYLAALLAALPLQMQPLRDSLASLRRPHGPDVSLQGRTLQGWRSHAVTLSALAAACLLAIATPSVWPPLELLGASAGAAIACILPGALALSLAGRRVRSRHSVIGVLLLAYGVLLAGAAVARAVLR